MIRASVVICALLVAAGCAEDKSKGGAPSAGKSASSAPAASSGAKKGPTAEAAGDPLDKEDIPVVEDFEDEAEKTLNDDNIDDEIDKLDKEISGDKE